MNMEVEVEVEVKVVFKTPVKLVECSFPAAFERARARAPGTAELY